MNLNEYKKCFLDLKKISLLSEDEKNFITNLYRDMINSVQCNQMVAGESYFHTLKMGGYLKNVDEESRDTKVDQIIKS
jgi:hypothetical protein